MIILKKIIQIKNLKMIMIQIQAKMTWKINKLRTSNLINLHLRKIVIIIVN